MRYHFPNSLRERLTVLAWRVWLLGHCGCGAVASMSSFRDHAFCSCHLRFGRRRVDHRLASASADHIHPGGQVVLAVWLHVAGGKLLRHATGKFEHGPARA